MSKILNLKSGSFSSRIAIGKKPGKAKKTLFITLFVVALAAGLSTAGIKASDKIFSALSVEESICPPDMAYIPNSAGGFCLDKYEVSAGGNCAYANPENQEQTRLNLENSACVPESRIGAIPWRNISQDQAKVACAKAGKRLPVSEEWMQAALGTPDISSGWSEADCQVDNNWSSQPGLTGSGENCHSPFGIFDMIGNVWEWTEGNISAGQYQGIDVPESGFVKGFSAQGLPVATDQSEADLNYNNDYFWVKNEGVRGIARGGYWNNQAEAGIYSAYVVVPPSFVGTGVGFRCAQ